MIYAKHESQCVNVNAWHIVKNGRKLCSSEFGVKLIYGKPVNRSEVCRKCLRRFRQLSQEVE